MLALAAGGLRYWMRKRPEQFSALLPRLLSARPEAILLIGGAGLLLAGQGIHPLLLNDLKWQALALQGVGLAFFMIGAWGLGADGLPKRLSGLLDRVSGWLKINPGQIIYLLAALAYGVTAALAAGGKPQMRLAPVALLAWLAAIIFSLLGTWQLSPTSGKSPRTVIRWALAFTLVGILIRGVYLTYIPTALSGDEAGAGIFALEYIDGKFDNLFTIGWYAFPSLYFYLQSIFISLFGQTIAALRLSSTLIGGLTVGAVYLVGRNLFGRRTGLFAAIFLSAFHFHVMFSRIGLNNIWDGFWFLIVLGALWDSWQNERRSSFILTGLTLGIAQYFYVSVRGLFLLVPLWLLIVGLLDRPRLKRNLSNIILMGVITLVVVLPLAWFYAGNLDQFNAPLDRVTILSTWLPNEVEITGLPAWRILLKQIWISAQGFIYIPLISWYTLGIPLLQGLSAGLFLLGLGLLLLRIRKPVAPLLLMWLAIFTVMGGLSDMTPASQRYIAVAPACALLVGLAVSEITRLLTRIWRAQTRLLNLAAVTVLLFLAATNLRFFFLDYTPQEIFGGPNTVVAQHLADYLKDKSDKWQVVFFGLPRMAYTSIPNIQYLAPHIEGLTLEYAWGTPENPSPTSDHLIFVFLPDHEEDLALVQADYPNAQVYDETDRNYNLLYWYLVVSPDGPPSPSAPSTGSPFLAYLTGVLVVVLLSGAALATLLRLLTRPSQPLSEGEPDEEISYQTHLTIPPPGQETPSEPAQRTVQLEDGRQVRLTVETLDQGDMNGDAPPDPIGVMVYASPTFPLGVRLQGVWVRLKRRIREARWPYPLPTTFFGLAVAIYLLIRLIGLSDYPIYFFTDEAVQTVLAADLVRDNFKNHDEEFLPTYFRNGNQYNLSLSVYLQVLPYLFFGKSVFVTRAASVLVTVVAAISVGLILRDFLKMRYWWAGTLLLSIAPAWFLHSRTAFETALMVSLYAGFIYAYLSYRFRSPRHLYPAILLAALAFYSYSPGQLVIAATALLLFLSDIRYHWENRRTILIGLGLVILLALPYLRFRLTHPEAVSEHLRNLVSYWIQPLPFTEKLGRFWSEYAYGLSPGYWFGVHGRDMVRHQMGELGHLLRPTLPFFALGLVVAIFKFRHSAARAILIALVAAPVGAALVEIGITRTLAFVIPASLLTAIGLSASLKWLERFRLPRKALQVALFLALAAANFGLLRAALVEGPTWSTQYDLGGMQYGARQLFTAVQDYVEEHPGTEIIVSPTWSNGTDVVARFFLPAGSPVRMGSIQGHVFELMPLNENMLFVMTPDEYETATQSGKFTDIQIERILPYPDGRPGFYFVRLRYVDDIAEILEAEREARKELVENLVMIDGQTVKARYTGLDMGEIALMFDDDDYSLTRSLEANPAVIELTFPEAREFSGVSLVIGSSTVEVTVSLYGQPGEDPVVFTGVFTGSVDAPEVHFDFGEAVTAKMVRIEVLDTNQGDPGHVHIWEIRFWLPGTPHPG